MKLLTIFSACLLVVTADHTNFCRNKTELIGGQHFTSHDRQPLENVTITKCIPALLREDEKIELNDYSSIMKIEGAYWEVERVEKVDIIKDDTFSNLSNLKKLFITQVDLDELEPNAFRGLEGLEELSLYRNKLTTLPAGIFDDVPNLTALNLAINKITEIDEHLFDQLNKLEELSLATNNLTVLPTNWAQRLTSLKTLNLNANRFEVLKSGMFDGLTNLKSLSLDVNFHLKKIEKNTFKGLDKLENLSMLYCRPVEADMEHELNHLQNLKTLAVSPGNFDCQNLDQMFTTANSRNISFTLSGSETCWSH